TLRRLIDVGWPRWMVVLFFIPVVNLVLFVVLSLAPGRQHILTARKDSTRGLVAPLFERAMPTSSLGSATFGVIITTAFCLIIVMLSTEFYKRYGYGLF